MYFTNMFFVTGHVCYLMTCLIIKMKLLGLSRRQSCKVMIYNPRRSILQTHCGWFSTPPFLSVHPSMPGGPMLQPTHLITILLFDSSNTAPMHVWVLARCTRLRSEGWNVCFDCELEAVLSCGCLISAISHCRHTDWVNANEMWWKASPLGGAAFAHLRFTTVLHIILVPMPQPSSSELPLDTGTCAARVINLG